MARSRRAAFLGQTTVAAVLPLPTRPRNGRVCEALYSGGSRSADKNSRKHDARQTIPGEADRLCVKQLSTTVRAANVRTQDASMQHGEWRLRRAEFAATETG